MERTVTRPRAVQDNGSKGGIPDSCMNCFQPTGRVLQQVLWRPDQTQQQHLQDQSVTSNRQVNVPGKKS